MSYGTGDYPNALMEVVVEVVTNEQCSAVYQGTINDGMICAGGVEGEDSCQVLTSHWLTGHHLTSSSPPIG